MAGEKRSAEELNQHQESVVILDVEGTTSSISFVKDTLFPHVREHLKKHLTEKWDDEEFKADLAKLKEQAKEDEEQKLEGFIAIKDGDDDEAKETIVKNVLWQMDNDRKTGALKQLQGHIWKAKHAPLKGHVYDDVPKAFEEWTNSDKKLYIYSSGSVEAQKLLFGDSVHGDLLKYLSGHFDTDVGPKQEADSYKNILKQINVEPENALFLTDVIKEAEAAKAAGLSTTIVIREGNAKLSDEEKTAFKTIQSFAELTFQSANKRQKIEDEAVTEKKDASNEESAVIAEDSAAEPMDTSEVDATEKKIESKTDETVVESKVEETEKMKESEKPTENGEKLEKEVAPMEEDTVADETVTKSETEKAETEPVKDVKENEENIKTATEEKSKTEVSIETEKKVEEAEIKSDETEKKTEEITKEAEKVTEEMKVEAAKVEPAATKETEEVVEKIAEKVTEKVIEDVAEKMAEETTEAKKIDEVKSEEKEVLAAEKKPAEEIKENGESKIVETEKSTVPTEDKVDEGENKENVGTKVEETTTESEVEVAEEAKEVEKEMEPEDKAKSETETQKDDSKKLNGTTTNGDSTKDVAEKKVHSNGVSDEDEKTKENGDAEESLKVKKAVADGAGEPDVVTPPVVAATS